MPLTRTRWEWPIYAVDGMKRLPRHGFAIDQMERSHLGDAVGLNSSPSLAM